MTTVAHTVRHTAAADGVCFCGTSVVPGGAVHLGSFENGEGTPALAVIAVSATALSTGRELAGVGWLPITC